MTAPIDRLRAHLKMATHRLQRMPVGHDFGSWDGVCPDCGCTTWRPGPRGGESQNITCAGCGCRLNMFSWQGVLEAQRI